MASIRKDVMVGAPAQLAWDALRDFGAVHQRVAPGFVVDAEADGGDRVVTFASGARARERLVAIDDERRRLVYTVVDGPLGAVHHQASVEVAEADDGLVRHRLEWRVRARPWPRRRFDREEWSSLVRSWDEAVAPLCRADRPHRIRAMGSRRWRPSTGRGRGRLS